MDDREPTIIRRLLDRLIAARARRDREARFSQPWHAADAEMHAIERAIFRVPTDGTDGDGRRRDRRPTPGRRPTRLVGQRSLRQRRPGYEARRAG
jgi:hypothetical protein